MSSSTARFRCAHIPGYLYSPTKGHEHLATDNPLVHAFIVRTLGQVAGRPWLLGGALPRAHHNDHGDQGTNLDRNALIISYLFPVPPSSIGNLSVILCPARLGAPMKEPHANLHLSSLGLGILAASYPAAAAMRDSYPRLRLKTEGDCVCKMQRGLSLQAIPNTQEMKDALHSLVIR